MPTDALPTAADLRQLFASVAALLRDWPGYTLRLALAVTWDVAGARWDGSDRMLRWQAACAGLERLHGGRDWQGLRGESAERLVRRALEAAETLRESGRVSGDWPPGY
jgi:hypothetical protein